MRNEMFYIHGLENSIGDYGRHFEYNRPFTHSSSTNDFADLMNTLPHHSQQITQSRQFSDRSILEDQFYTGQKQFHQIFVPIPSYSVESIIKNEQSGTFAVSNPRKRLYDQTFAQPYILDLQKKNKPSFVYTKIGLNKFESKNFMQLKDEVGSNRCDNNELSTQNGHERLFEPQNTNLRYTNEKKIQQGCNDCLSSLNNDASIYRTKIDEHQMFRYGKNYSIIENPSTLHTCENYSVIHDDVSIQGNSNNLLANQYADYGMPVLNLNRFSIEYILDLQKQSTSDVSDATADIDNEIFNCDETVHEKYSPHNNMQHSDKILQFSQPQSNISIFEHHENQNECLSIKSKTDIDIYTLNSSEQNARSYAQSRDLNFDDERSSESSYLDIEAYVEPTESLQIELNSTQIQSSNKSYSVDTYLVDCMKYNVEEINSVTSKVQLKVEFSICHNKIFNSNHSTKSNENNLQLLHEKQNFWLFRFPKMKKFEKEYLKTEDFFDDLNKVIETISSTYRIAKKAAFFLNKYLKSKYLSDRFSYNCYMRINSILGMSFTDLKKLDKIISGKHEKNMAILKQIITRKHNKSKTRYTKFQLKLIHSLYDSDFIKDYKNATRKNYNLFTNLVRLAEVALNYSESEDEMQDTNESINQFNLIFFSSMKGIATNHDDRQGELFDLILPTNFNSINYDDTITAIITQKYENELQQSRVDKSEIDFGERNTFIFESKQNCIILNSREIIENSHITTDNFMETLIFQDNQSIESSFNEKLSLIDVIIKTNFSIYRKLKNKVSDKIKIERNTELEEVTNQILTTYLKYFKKIIIENDRFEVILNYIKKKNEDLLQKNSVNIKRDCTN